MALMTTKQKIRRAVLKAKDENSVTENGNLLSKVEVTDITLDTTYGNTDIEFYDKTLDITHSIKLNYNSNIGGEWVETDERKEEVCKFLQDNLEVADLVQLVDEKSSVLGKEMTLFYTETGFTIINDKESGEYFTPVKFEKAFARKKDVKVTKIVNDNSKVYVVFEMDGVDGYAKSFSKKVYSKKHSTFVHNDDVLVGAHKNMIAMFGTTDLESLVGQEFKVKIVSKDFNGSTYNFVETMESDCVEGNLEKLEIFLDKKETDKLTPELAIEFIEEHDLPTYA